uniref:Uncharacterized protein n=1 Tax=Kalanchoe fedtschenkoi TaxID=63787 RepID=A0A7N0U0K6_KALFE
MNFNHVNQSGSKNDDETSSLLRRGRSIALVPDPNRSREEGVWGRIEEAEAVD